MHRTKITHTAGDVYNKLVNLRTIGDVMQLQDVDKEITQAIGMLYELKRAYIFIKNIKN